ncbi:MAG: hypothetical protein ACTSQI_22285 [Candidatus Helarchaeota archaeon]
MKKTQAEVAAQEGWDKLYTGRLYDLRHAAITDMYLQGFIDQEVRALVGGSPASRMPNVYVHVQERHLLTACRRVELHRYSTPPEMGAEFRWEQNSPAALISGISTLKQNIKTTLIPRLLARYSPPHQT